MASPQARRIFLTGFSGSGKSVVAPLVAGALAWRAIDTDDIVERLAARSIPDIFARDGEGAFRELERRAVAEATAQEDIVVAVGGGAVLMAENRRAMARGGFVVCLEARADVLWDRLRSSQGPPAAERPLLSGSDPLGRIRSLKALRQPLYALADFTVHTDHLTPQQVADEVVRAWREMSAAALAHRAVDDRDAAAEEDAAVWVRLESGSYPVHVEWGGLQSLAGRMREAGLRGVAHVITDESVWRSHGERALAALRAGGFEADAHRVPPGDEAKSLASATALYEELVAERAERGHAVVALGGGMIGDLAGFVAATYLRGLALVQTPTTLLSMVDASIGGKVAVNLPQGKNLVGAFYQPRLVLADVSTLTSLPPRELASGWAEVIKHAFIADEGLLPLLEEGRVDLRALEPGITAEVVRRNVAIKARVVSEDEHETTGRRMILNYGHTVAHAIEAATGYRGPLHGEAVAVGMMAAAEIGRDIGLTPPDLVLRQRRLLETYGLPTTLSGIDAARVREAMALDKKVAGRAIRWVLLEGVSRPVLRDDVPANVVDSAIEQLLGEP